MVFGKYELEKYHIKGIALAIISDMEDVKIDCEGEGINKQQVTDTSLFSVGSISKWVTAWGIMKLHQDGVIDIDQSVTKYLSDLSVYVKLRTDITVRQLLSHTSGLASKIYIGKSMGKKTKIKDCFLNSRDVYKELKVRFNPGEKFEYTGSGYTLLQLIIEKVSGISFEQYMTENVFRPLGMTNSYFHVPRELLDDSKSIRMKNNNLREYSKAAAGLYTNISDLIKFAKANMESSIEKNDGILNKFYVNLMQQRVRREIPYGLGNYIYSLPNDNKVVMHDGLNIGWMSRVLILPHKSKGIIILCRGNNASKCISQITLQWLEEQVGELKTFYRSKLQFSSYFSYLAKKI